MIRGCLRRDSAEKEARGETVLAPSAHVMALWRASLWAQTAVANAGRWAHNALLSPVTKAPPKEYKEAKLPLNTEGLINLLFRYVRGTARRSGADVPLFPSHPLPVFRSEWVSVGTISLPNRARCILGLPTPRNLM